jgi:translation initiation factor IF-1
VGRGAFGATKAPQSAAAASGAAIARSTFTPVGPVCQPQTASPASEASSRAKRRTSFAARSAFTARTLVVGRGAGPVERSIIVGLLPSYLRERVRGAPAIAVKEEKIEMEGEIVESLRSGMFRIRLDNGHELLGYTAGKMKRYRIRMGPGDRVLVEVSAYDLDRGRIIYRLR